MMRERAVELERFANGKRGGERQGNVARLVEMYRLASRLSRCEVGACNRCERVQRTGARAS